MITRSLTFELGVLVRGFAKREVTKYCLENGLECRIEEVGGLLESIVVFRITGPESRVNQAVVEIQRWIVS